MERPHPIITQKCSSFSFSSSAREDKKLCESDRNFSLDSKERYENTNRDNDKLTPIEAEEDKQVPGTKEDDDAEPNLPSLSDDIDRFITTLRACSDPPDIPDTVDRFVALVEREITRYESGDEKQAPDDTDLFDAIGRLSGLASALSPHPNHFDAMSRAGGVLHHTMCFLEDELFSLLGEPRKKQNQEQGSSSTKTKGGPSFGRNPDHSPQSPAGSEATTVASPTYPPEVVARLQAIAGAMISAGYATECCEVFSVARRNAVETTISELGFDKVSIDDVQRMAWDSLEAEIAKWVKAFRHSVTESLPHERDLCNEVFSGHPAIAGTIFRHLAGSVVSRLLTFAEAVAMTKRAAEKLFKVLDMYEALRDMTQKIEHVVGNGESEGDDGESSSSRPTEIKSEISSARTHLGDAAVAIFCDLECSIKSDTGKTPVPGGAVHPLTRYVMNYLKYACEYKNTLEQVFKEHQKLDKGPSLPSSDYDGDAEPKDDGRTPFASQLIEVMELLHSNIETKSKLYKDLALSNVFMMNNGRYIVQKIKGSTDINQLLGETWCRKRSSDLRQFHKNYQRETWSKVLGCLKDEGLTAKGSVQKPVLKERLKSFNAMFEEIHKTQSSWVVSDEQLQSELRVSVSAVVVPAYRSFLGRFSQYLAPGRQTEKYVKFGAEDLETYIDDLFDGNPASMVRRRP